MLDLTERKQAEGRQRLLLDERKRAEYLTGQVFESSPDGVCIVGRDYRYQRVNPSHERNWGVPTEKIVGMHVAEVVGINVFEQTIKPQLDQCFAGEEVSYAEWFTNSCGRRYMAITYSPMRPDAKQVEAALVISRDLTEHVSAAEALRETQMELAHVNRVTTMGQLTASIAHEVNQPIAAMVTNADTALRWLGAEPPNLAKAQQALARIGRDGLRAGEVIGRIRALIKKVSPRKDRLDINQTILEVISLTRGELQRNGVSLETQLADLPLIQADRIQLQQVILNLIINAVQAMSEVREGSRELWISTGTDASGQVLVAVRDSGPGLNREASTASSTLSTRPRRTAWAWDYRSAVRSSRLKAAECGLRPTYPRALSFSSRYLRKARVRHDRHAPLPGAVDARFFPSDRPSCAQPGS